MTRPNFVNYHVLISHNPSNINRDDMNMQKLASFGGVRRVRYSSQCLKRAMRFSDYYQERFGEPSIRTRNLELLARKLEESLQGEFESKWIRKAVEVMAERKLAAEADDDQADDEGDEQEAKLTKKGKKTAVAPWSIAEMRIACEVVTAIYETPLTDAEQAVLKKEIEGEKKRKASEKKPKRTDDEMRDAHLLPKVKAALEKREQDMAFARAQTKDIALSGRMAASGLMPEVDGAMAVAHVITTHEVEGSVDWFTAVDDLVGGDDRGAGHLDRREFSSGVFYRYASLNLKQLQVNLGLIENIRSPETNESRAAALDIARHLLHLLATVVPSGYQMSHAAFNPADFALVSFSDVPVSLANAFESPVQVSHPVSQGLVTPSIKDLVDYWAAVNVAYGQMQAKAFSIKSRDLPEGLDVVPSLEKLKEWVAADGA